jgi:uncharacterized protein
MDTSGIQLQYSDIQKRIRVTFTLAACFEHEYPPEFILAKSRSKFMDLKNSGEIDHYILSSQDLEDVWARVRSDKRLATKKRTISMTLGNAAPHIEEISVRPTNSVDIAMLLSLAARPELMREWRFEFVLVNVSMQMKELGIMKRMDMARLYSAWMRACRGEPVRNKPIQALNVKPSRYPYQILSDNELGEIYLAIHDEKVFHSERNLEIILDQARKTSLQLGAIIGEPLEFLDESLFNRLSLAMRGRERYGIKLPASFLVALPKRLAWVVSDSAVITLSQRQAIASSRKRQMGGQKKQPIKDETYPGRGLLKIEVAEDKMQASVVDFNMGWYDSNEFVINEDWLTKELYRLGIAKNAASSQKDQWMTALNDKGDLNDMVVAVGTPAGTPENPYLFPLFKDADWTKDGVNLREKNKVVSVKIGDPICEIRFGNEGEKGFDVFGNTVLPVLPTNLSIQVDGGVEQEGSRFIATTNGLPVVDGLYVAVKQVMLIESDVNMKTGNIYYDGDVEVVGSIEEGSVVNAKGNLKVHGSISSAFIRVGGNLEVLGGVMTTERGWVKVKGDLTADFIEHSQLYVGGSLRATKSIIGGKAFVNKEIHTDPESGILGGGEYYVNGDIHAGSVGFEEGAITHIKSGVEYRSEVRLQHRQTRKDRLNAELEKIKLAQKELRGIKENQRDPKQTEDLKRLTKLAIKFPEILKKVDEYVNEARKARAYNKEAVVYCYKVLAKGCRIEIAGLKIPINQSFAGVKITHKQLRNQHIHSLEQAPPSADGSQEEIKKAS